MSIDIDKLEEWTPTGSYSYTASETYSSTLFRFRTGRDISVLEIGPNLITHEIKFFGKHKVTTEQECWDIFMKFRADKVCEIVSLMVNKACDIGFTEGRNSLKTDLRKLLEQE